MSFLGKRPIFGIFEKQKITPNGVDNIFTLKFKVSQAISVLVIKNGNVLEGGPGGDYAITGNHSTRIFFNDVPLVSDDIFILFLGRELSVAKTIGSEPVYFSVVADGVQSSFNMPIGPIIPDALIVFLNKELQRLNDDFTVSGSDVVFNTTPNNNDVIDFYIHGIERGDNLGIKGWTIESPNNNFIPNGPNQDIGSSSQPIGNLHVGGDATIIGDLTVSGTTTTLNTEDLLIEDNKITLNSNFTSGVPVLNLGIEGKRGDEADAVIRWNETFNHWEAGVQGDIRKILVSDDAIETLNGLSDPNQTFATGTSGTNFNISSAGSVHTFNIPDASSTNRGLITTGTQTIAGAKTFSNTITGSITGNSGTSTVLQTPRLINGTSFNGSSDITTSFWGTSRNITIGNTLKAVNGSSDVSWSLSEIGVNNGTLTLATSGIASGSQSFSANQSSNATFTVHVPGTNLSVVNGTTDGPTINSSTGTGVEIPPASDTISGVVTTGNQSFSGVKTFLDGISASISGNADSATVLQTARLINGTSFNGSSDITTSFWGTSRDITIGSSTKSVNGSSNISWTLGEIGVGNGTLTLATSGIASGSQSFTANQSSNATFTVDVPGTDLSVTNGTTSGPIINSSTGDNVEIPPASDTISGVVTTGNQSFSGVKTFLDGISASISGNADTATTLATPRLINGTSFDGSSDITTATWGTSRNITIGNTLKAINGSSNVSWTLAEIGVNNGTLTLATSGIASGSQTFDANQSSNVTFTVNVPGTNIAQGTRTATTVPVTSSTGSGATLESATTTLAGVMSAGDKTKLDGIEAGAEVNLVTSVASKTGDVVLNNSDVGLGNVTNHAQVRKLSSSTNGNIPIWNGTTGDQLSDGYGVETTLTGSSSNIPRADAVKNYVDGFLTANDAMIFKGTLGSGGTYTSLPTTHDVGWTIKVITAGTYAGQVAEVGDMYISLVNRTGSGNQNSDWAVIQTNIDGAVVGPSSSTNNNVVLFDGTTGKLIKDSGTLLGNGTLTLATSGIATGSQTFGANQNSNATFTVNVPGTNIAQGTRTATTVPVTSSTGSDATLQVATTSLAGVMSAGDKTKLDGIETGAEVNVGTNIAQGTRTATTVPITSSTGSDATLQVATTSLAGVMSASDKTKLDGIASNAQPGTVTSIDTNNGLTGGPITNSGTIGLTGQALALHNFNTNGIIARTGASTFAGRTITAGTGISISNGDGVSGNPTITNSAPHVGTNIAQGTRTATTVPITSSTGSDATLDVATTTLAGVMSASDKTKLDGIASNAQPGTLESLNGLTDATQTFATGTSGTNFNISSAGSVHTFNIPDASSTNRGLITTDAQTIAGRKTFSGGLTNPVNLNAGGSSRYSTANDVFSGSENIHALELSTGGWRNASVISNRTDITAATTNTEGLYLNSVWSSSPFANTSIHLNCRTGGSTGNIRFLTGNSTTAPTEKMILTNAGSLGVGTSSPSQKLHVSSGADSDSGDISIAIGGTNSTNARQARITKSTSTPYDFSIVAGLNSSTPVDTVFYQNQTTEAMRIKWDGNVGIGTNNPTSRLSIHGSNSVSFNALLLRNTDTTAGAVTQFAMPVFNNASGLSILQSSNATGPAWASGAYDAIIRTGQSPAHLHFAGGANQNPHLSISNIGNVSISSTTASTSTTTGALTVAGGVGINGTLNAIAKSFIIPHPTKSGKKLRHGSLEGPEYGVYVRGELKNKNIIELPEYWTELIDNETITVNLTPIGKFQNLYVKEIKNNCIVIENEKKNSINCFYIIYAERKDIDKLEVECD